MPKVYTQCLTEGDGLPPLLAGGKVVDASHRHALQASRAALPLRIRPLQAHLAPLLRAAPAGGF